MTFADNNQPNNLFGGDFAIYIMYRSMDILT